LALARQPRYRGPRCADRAPAIVATLLLVLLLDLAVYIQHVLFHQAYVL
jgi:sterol desaturase/sphingolipid hydroxylase (fatty acid hydroxylase superfamily)